MKMFSLPCIEHLNNREECKGETLYTPFKKNIGRQTSQVYYSKKENKKNQKN